MPAEAANELGPESVAIFPQKVRLIVGPGMIATRIIVAATARQRHLINEIAVGVAAFWRRSGQRYSPRLASGLTYPGILAAVAIEVVATGLRCPGACNIDVASSLGPGCFIARKRRNYIARTPVAGNFCRTENNLEEICAQRSSWP